MIFFFLYIRKQLGFLFFRKIRPRKNNCIEMKAGDGEFVSEANFRVELPFFYWRKWINDCWYSEVIIIIRSEETLKISVDPRYISPGIRCAITRVIELIILYTILPRRILSKPVNFRSRKIFLLPRTTFRIRG